VYFKFFSLVEVSAQRSVAKMMKRRGTVPNRKEVDKWTTDYERILIGQSKVKENVHALSSIQWNRRKELEKMLRVEIMLLWSYHQCCRHQSVRGVLGINGVDIGSIASERRDGHPRSV
jgi:hypothetical protein